MAEPEITNPAPEPESGAAAPAGATAVHATPLNHVGLWVDDLPKAVEWMTANGVRFAPGGIRKGAAGHDICFIHPKGNDEFPLGGEGVLIELVQAPPEVELAQQRRGAGSRLLARPCRREHQVHPWSNDRDLVEGDGLGEGLQRRDPDRHRVGGR